MLNRDCMYHIAQFADDMSKYRILSTCRVYYDYKILMSMISLPSIDCASKYGHLEVVEFLRNIL